MERTFHHGKHELHGITVVVETSGAHTFIGRCDDITDERVLLLDVAVHDGTDGQKDDFIAKAAKFGHWAKEKALAVPRESVTNVIRLADVTA